MAFSNPIVAGLKLLIAAIQSPNFITGVSGWSINKDGSAEFNNLTIRGTFMGTNFEINSSGAFFYSGTPALGNILVSIAGTAGTDPFGNNYPAGIKDFGLMSVESGDSHGGLIIIMHTPTTSNPGTISVFETDATHGSFATAVSGDAHARHVVRTSGRMEWGDGTNAADLAIQRLSAGLLEILQSVQVDGTITATGGTATTPTLITTDTWTAATLGTGWSTIAGLQVPQYRLTPDNMIEIVGGCQTTSTTPSAVVFTLDSNHRPATDQRGLYAVERVTSPDVAHAVDIGTGGAFTLLNNLTVSGRPLYIYARIPKS